MEMVHLNGIRMKRRLHSTTITKEGESLHQIQCGGNKFIKGLASTCLMVQTERTSGGFLSTGKKDKVLK